MKMGEDIWVGAMDDHIPPQQGGQEQDKTDGRAGRVLAKGREREVDVHFCGVLGRLGQSLGCLGNIWKEIRYMDKTIEKWQKKRKWKKRRVGGYLCAGERLGQPAASQSEARPANAWHASQLVIPSGFAKRH